MKVTTGRVQYVEEREGASSASLILVVVLLIGSAFVITLLTGPFNSLLGEQSGAIPAAFHATAAFIYLFVGAIGLYLAWRLWIGRIYALADLQLLATVAATFSFLDIVFGNWLYTYYRMKGPSSPRSYFLATNPAIHKIFFEFKEYAALFTLPLTVTAAFVLWYYGGQILERRWLRYMVAILLALSFFYLVVAFGLGAAVTKLKSA